ncbi:uncharacterized protein Dana_GF22701 [Drosophila ananassae]|uniref:Protein quiver n=1 Tax=Drosophila ananassae TaxID=7217 RepID=B3MUR7_DROAN|nr:uncharacterized protein LOC6505355 [Drosophila ananassae]EDV32982.2 uncharacterized protein Dana_GF22701 [Drosophila ananassae]
MNAKLVIAGVLLAFVCVQFADSLVCYTCTTPKDCKSPKKVTCTNNAANETSNYLNVYHQGVRNATSTRFDCLALKYTWNNDVIHQLHGCVHPAVGACSLSLKPAYSHFNKTRCVLCSGNKCNKNPAGKVSSSSITIAASIVGIVLAKIYA